MTGSNMGEAQAAIRVLIAQQDKTPWFWRPQLHWFGWQTLIPIMFGHDEYARRTLVLGWTFTGRVIFPLWDCGDAECAREAVREMQENSYD